MESMQLQHPYNPKMVVTVISGHFATRHSHNTRYLDITRMKHEHTMAREAAVRRRGQFRRAILRAPAGGVSPRPTGDVIRNV